MSATDTPTRRPTLVAGVVALVVVAFAANDASATYGTPALLAVAGGAVLAAATGLAGREEPLAVLAASVLAPAGGVAVLAAVALSLADPLLLDGLLDPFVVLGLAAAGFGATAAFTGGVGGGAVGRAFSVVSATTTLPLLAVFAAGASRVGREAGVVNDFGALLGGFARLLVEPTGTTVDVAAFLVLFAVTTRALAAGVDAAPVVALAPRAYRDTAARATELTVVVCLSAWRLAALAWPVTAVVAISGVADRIAARAPDPLAATAGAVASSGGLRVAMLAAVVVSLAVYAVLRVGRLATGDHRESLQRVAPTVGGGLLAAAVGVVFAGRVVAAARRAAPEPARPVLDNAVELAGEPTLALVALVVPLLGLGGLLVAFAVLGSLRVVPQRAAPAAVAAAGLVLAGAAAGVQAANPGFVFGLVAAGMVVWDVGEHGVGLAAELGRRAPTARVELVHVAASVALGALAYYGAQRLYDATAGLDAPDQTGAFVALAAAGIALAALVAALAD
ncbi:DUF7519 family protein [Halobacterium jilantaiense]|uniref:Uncharacterized protein n=1 Tax=Halobacterium jilantaiense TaxID=355548 RepID=A0A1I0MF53_9EURY|nr:hypothetical protein [Halobacterium jilantaiense]SEV87047.1 hypothetical protein SAMN04487945_0020 [Halobacterium jilantaiense]